MIQDLDMGDFVHAKECDYYGCYVLISINNSRILFVILLKHGATFNLVVL
jgi:hypothetical protein